MGAGKRKVRPYDSGCTDSKRVETWKKGREKTHPLAPPKKERMSVSQRLFQQQKLAALNPNKPAKSSKADDSEPAARSKNKFKQSADGATPKFKDANDVQFQTVMRPGESFKSYSRRLQRETRAITASLVGPTQFAPMNEKRKEHLEKRKEKKEKAKSTSGAAAAAGDDSDDEDFKTEADLLRESLAENDPRRTPEAELRHRAKRIKTDFDKREIIKFGEVADRPPTLLLPTSTLKLPQRKTKPISAALTGVAAPGAIASAPAPIASAASSSSSSASSSSAAAAPVVDAAFRRVVNESFQAAEEQKKAHARFQEAKALKNTASQMASILQGKALLRAPKRGGGKQQRKASGKSKGAASSSSLWD